MRIIFKMEAKKIEYYEGGEEHDFLENDVMNEKIELFTKFLIRVGIDFKVEYLGDASGKFITLENGVCCVFNKAGLVKFEYDKELEDNA